MFHLIFTFWQTPLPALLCRTPYAQYHQQSLFRHETRRQASSTKPPRCDHEGNKRSLEKSFRFLKQSTLSFILTGPLLEENTQGGTQGWNQLPRSKRTNRTKRSLSLAPAENGGAGGHRQGIVFQIMAAGLRASAPPFARTVSPAHAPLNTQAEFRLSSGERK